MKKLMIGMVVAASAVALAACSPKADETANLSDTNVASEVELGNDSLTDNSLTAIDQTGTNAIDANVSGDVELNSVGNAAATGGNAS